MRCVTHMHYGMCCNGAQQVSLSSHLGNQSVICLSSFFRWVVLVACIDWLPYTDGMKIAIGTLRAPKIAGVEEAFRTSPYFADSQLTVEFVPHDAPSGISHMPLSQNEVMQGARNRAEYLLAHVHDVDFCIGLEGGTSKVAQRAYLFGCAYLCDHKGVGYFGFSPWLMVPEVVTRMLYDEGKELGPIMRDLAKGKDVRSENGSMGEWSNDMLTRKDEFVAATQAALAPHFNSYYRM